MQFRIESNTSQQLCLNNIGCAAVYKERKRGKPFVKGTAQRSAAARPDYNHYRGGSCLETAPHFLFSHLVWYLFQQLLQYSRRGHCRTTWAKRRRRSVGGATGTLLSVIVNLLVGIASGTTVVVAQLYGARNTDGVRRAVHTSVAMSRLQGRRHILMVLFICADWALAAMGTTTDVMGCIHLISARLFFWVQFRLFYIQRRLR